MLCQYNKTTKSLLCQWGVVLFRQGYDKKYTRLKELERELLIQQKPNRFCRAVLQILSDFTRLILSQIMLCYNVTCIQFFPWWTLSC